MGYVILLHLYELCNTAISALKFTCFFSGSWEGGCVPFPFTFQDVAYPLLDFRSNYMLLILPLVSERGRLDPKSMQAVLLPNRCANSGMLELYTTLSVLEPPCSNIY